MGTSAFPWGWFALLVGAAVLVGLVYRKHMQEVDCERRGGVFVRRAFGETACVTQLPGPRW